ncbi:hypothetical protein, partial [Hypericibacter sp.]|uniref:hypothetical protein n=1 Tax=Hypericibacter sp. TaxID=2705401 RepID=UPI003D6CFCD8
MRRHLARPGLPQLAQNQRPRRRNPPDQPIRPLLNPNIPKQQALTLGKITPKTLNHIYIHSGITSVNAVA